MSYYNGQRIEDEFPEKQEPKPTVIGVGNPVEKESDKQDPIQEAIILLKSFLSDKAAPNDYEHGKQIGYENAISNLEFIKSKYQPSPEVEKERVCTLQEMMDCWDHAIGSTSDLLSGKVEYFKTKFDININDYCSSGSGK